MITANRRKVATALVAVALVLLTGCGSSIESSDGGGYAMEEPMAMEADMATEQSRTNVAPQIIRTANAYLEVDSVNDAVKEVESVTNAAQGTIDAQNITRGDDWASASFTLRIPEERLDQFLEDLSNIGEVTSLDVNSQDVTLEVVDVEARIQTLQDSIARLRALQQQATSVSDLVAVEAELANRQSDLESLTARRDYLANQVSLSTVYLSISERQVGPSLSPDFLGGLQRGWDALLTLGAGLITALGFMAPTAIVIALIVILVLWIIRRNRKRKKEKSS